MDGASQTNEYTYDANGNMTKDLNKNILSIQYNLLNLPRCMRLGNGNSAEYAYNAAGERLSTTYGDLTSGVTFYYSANYFYTYGAISNILIDGGYITLSGSTPVYHYYLKDHLGSNRVVCNASGTVEQANHYYPFGGLFGESTNASTQKYKYNGKEYDRVHGLDWYDYGARFMNPDMGRFTTIDPMAEKYYSISPYAYCHNNPINRIDPTGTDDYYSSNGFFLFRDQNTTDNIIIRNETLYNIKRMTGAEWLKPDTPIENITLSAEAYSNIFTNILSQMEDVNVGELHNQKVSVTVWEDSNDNLGICTKDRYNDAGLSGETLAETEQIKNGDRVISVYMYPKGTKEKSILNTVSNLQNLLGAHEYLGHYKNGWHNHNKVVSFQRSHYLWEKTTKEFRSYIYKVYEKNL